MRGQRCIRGGMKHGRRQHQEAQHRPFGGHCSRYGEINKEKEKASQIGADWSDVLKNDRVAWRPRFRRFAMGAVNLGPECDPWLGRKTGCYGTD